MGWRRILGRLAGPVGMTAAWGVRKALAAAYRKRTGRTPPRGRGDGTPMRHALLWSVLSAAALAIVEVLVQRVFRDEREATKPQPSSPEQPPQP